MVSIIIAIVLWGVLGALGIFYLDLANGHIAFLIVWCVALALFLIFRIFFYKKEFWKRLLLWLGLIAVATVSFFFAKPGTYVKPSGGDLQQPTVALTVEEGKLRGLYTKDGEVRVYTGIPYAAPPVGELRWKKPQKAPKWEGIRDCFTFAPRSYQPAGNPVMDSLVDIYAAKSWHPDFTMYPSQERSEDSLYLNVWAPKDASNAPVLIYYHGGSLTNGSAAEDRINGETFARNGVIMVTVAYRLGVFGYFAHPDLMAESGTTGNYGLLDQIQALKWVHDNIAAFGGDPSAITVAGESAGSSSVSALCVSPLSAGLFRYAIGESSSLVVNPTAPHTIRPLETAYKVGQKIMKEQNCSSIAELRKVDAEKLVNTKYANSSMTIDGYALTEEPYKTYERHANNETRLLNGYNVLEADAFIIPQYLLSPTNKGNIKARLVENFDEDTADKLLACYGDRVEKDAFSVFNEIFSIAWFIEPHDSWSKAALEAGDVVYRYQFTKENGFYGTYHSGEIIYAYGNLARSHQSFAYNNEDYQLMDKMVSYWISFVKTGVPSSSWEEYDPSSAKPVMDLGAKVGMMEDRYKNVYPIIEEYNAKPKQPKDDDK